MNPPKLQMHNPFHAILRYIIVVKQRVSYARDAEEQNAGCGEEEGTEVGSLGGLGDGGVDGEEGCFLDRFNYWLWTERAQALPQLWRPGRRTLLAWNRPSTTRHGGGCLFGWCCRAAFGARVFF